jgi:gamma-glutamylputrescine oxidase
MKADNLPVEWYEGPEGQGLLCPSDGVFQPMERVRLMARQAQQLGAILHSNSRAVSIARDQVLAENGSISCRLVIVAVDGKLELLLPELKNRVRTCRLQMIATAPATDVKIPRPVYRRGGYDYWQQLPDGCIALGGFRD